MSKNFRHIKWFRINQVGERWKQVFENVEADSVPALIFNNM